MTAGCVPQNEKLNQERKSLDSDITGFNKKDIVWENLKWWLGRIQNDHCEAILKK